MSLLGSGTLKELARSFSETMLLPFVSSVGASGLLFFGSWPIKDHHNGESYIRSGFAGQTYFVYILYIFYISFGSWPIKGHPNGEDVTKPGFAGQIYLACFCRLAFSSLGPERRIIFLFKEKVINT